MKKIAILGSTGSIGTQALELLHDSDNYQIDYLYTNSNYELLYKQIISTKPKFACINCEDSYNKLIEINDTNTEIICGLNNSLDFIKSRKVDLSLNAIVGISGLKPTLNVIESGTKFLALANKESLVMAGELVTKIADEKGVKILPVDSEHSAIWQCLAGENHLDISRIILTASGGPFRTLDKNSFKSITVEDALNHPNWEMGNKITIDSATMMNKGFEVIETKWLFGISEDRIDILVHPQSIIHSMVEFNDTSIKAQLGFPDMKIPINYALHYPTHTKLNLNPLNLDSIGQLTFEKPDLNKFQCIQLAYDAMESGGTSPAILNIANDLSVELFLNEKIEFNHIPKLIELCIANHDYISEPCIDDIFDQIGWVKNHINKNTFIS